MLTKSGLLLICRSKEGESESEGMFDKSPAEGSRSFCPLSLPASLRKLFINCSPPLPSPASTPTTSWCDEPESNGQPCRYENVSRFSAITWTSCEIQQLLPRWYLHLLFCRYCSTLSNVQFKPNYSWSSLSLLVSVPGWLNTVESVEKFFANYL